MRALIRPLSAESSFHPPTRGRRYPHRSRRSLGRKNLMRELWPLEIERQPSITCHVCSRHVVGTKPRHLLASPTKMSNFAQKRARPTVHRRASCRIPNERTEARNCCSACLIVRPRSQSRAKFSIYGAPPGEGRNIHICVTFACLTTKTFLTAAWHAEGRVAESDANKRSDNSPGDGRMHPLRYGAAKFIYPKARLFHPRMDRGLLFARKPTSVAWVASRRIRSS